MNMAINDEDVVSVTQVTKLVQLGTSVTITRLNTKQERYEWVDIVLTRTRYLLESKKNRGIIRHYLMMYGRFSSAQIDRLIARKRKTGTVALAPRTQPVFAHVYTRADIDLLAEVSELYRHQNGRALREVLRDMYTVYEDDRFERLSRISVSHLYNLRKTDRFMEQTTYVQKTRATTVAIGERRKPRPDGTPGYIRVDSVHQGDRDKEKGVYYVNLVDEVTQYEVVSCVAGISEEFLKDALEMALELFPFEIRGFHSDNGSEYINGTVARLLEKLRIEQTKSRSRRTNDNALVESKNGAVIRKEFGHLHIPRKYAPQINAYCQEYFVPFINFHRFSAFPDEETDANGKTVKRYDTFLTPIHKLLTLPHLEQYLKPDITAKSLQAQMLRQSHLDAAAELAAARKTLFKKINQRP
jgi:transposase InsO family protein